MHIRLNRGLHFRLQGVPDGANIDQPMVASVGLSGLDYPDVRPDFLVEVGQAVVAGQPLLRDRRRTDIVVTAPAAGTVTNVVRRDPETTAFFIRLSVSGVEPALIDVPEDWRRGDTVRKILLSSGLWTALLERPFGRLPDPDATADAILVTATSADVISPDPAMVIAGREAEFATGIEALDRLAGGPVYVCQYVGSDLAPDAVAFSGAYPAGLPGTHVHHICPVDEGRAVWTVNYQDVMAIGRLFNTGRLEIRRTVALAGPGMRAPCLLRVPLGANIDELVHGRMHDGDYRLVSGPFLSGREAQYLGRGHLQICGLPAAGRLGRCRFAPRSGAVGPIIPVAGHQQAFPFDLPVVPLLRALAVGDSETAKTLGCLELLEEDVAVLSYVCPSGNDYAPLLRSVLDELRRGM